MEISNKNVLNIFHKKMISEGKNEDGVLLKDMEIKEHLERDGIIVNIDHLKTLLNKCLADKLLEKVTMDNQLKITAHGLNFLHN